MFPGADVCWPRTTVAGLRTAVLWLSVHTCVITDYMVSGVCSVFLIPTDENLITERSNHCPLLFSCEKFLTMILLGCDLGL